MSLEFEKFKDRYQKVPVEEFPNRVEEAVPDPVVSIHVSTYQHADFIRDCLDGVLMQETDFPFEIIVGEDESDDGTREICKKYAEENPNKIRLFLHRRENNISVRGKPTGKFQLIYSHFISRGKYIAICEGDDYWTDPNKLKKQVGFLEENHEYVLTHHNAKKVNGKGELLSESKLPKRSKKDFTKKGLQKGPFILTLSLCFRNKIDKYPEEFFSVINEDKFLVSMLGRWGKGKYQEEVKRAVYREHTSGIWGKSPSEKRSIELMETFESLESYHHKKGSKEVKKHFSKRKKDANKSTCLRLISAGKYKHFAKYYKKTIFKNGYKIGIYEHLFFFLRIVNHIIKKKLLSS